MACLTSVIEPLRAANEISQTQVFSWQLIAENQTRICSSAGLVFEAAESLIEMEDKLDYLILLSAPRSCFESPKTAAKIRHLARHGTVLGAISGGIFPLVQSGAPLSPEISVHWCYSSAFEAKFPDILHSDDVLQISPICVTAAGAAAAFDLSLHFVERSLGAATAHEVACWFQHPMMRKSGMKQRMPVPTHDGDDLRGNKIVKEAIEIFSQDLSAPKSVTEIAALLNISSRHLERSFKSVAGMNPSKYFRQLRMKAARQIILYTNDDLASVASGVGYLNPASFIKQYRDVFGCLPQEDRRRINTFRVDGNRPLPSV